MAANMATIQSDKTNSLNIYHQGETNVPLLSSSLITGIITGVNLLHTLLGVAYFALWIVVIQAQIQTGFHGFWNIVKFPINFFFTEKFDFSCLLSRVF